MTATEVPRCQSWRVRYYRHVQCKHPLEHTGDHEGEVNGHVLSWENKEDHELSTIGSR